MLKFDKINVSGEVYFTSDTHYNHKNYVRGISSWSEDAKLKCRHFNTLEEMNETILSSINNTVLQNDTLFILGDIAFGGHQNIGIFFEKLVCENIVWVRGNHDHNMHLYLSNPKIKMCGDILNIDVLGTKMVLSHHPMFHWLNQEDGTWNLHGHLHGDEDEVLKMIHQYKSFDVGIDNFYQKYNKYGVFSLEMLQDIMKNKLVIGRH